MIYGFNDSKEKVEVLSKDVAVAVSQDSDSPRPFIALRNKTIQRPFDDGIGANSYADITVNLPIYSGYTVYVLDVKVQFAHPARTIALGNHYIANNGLHLVFRNTNSNNVANDDFFNLSLTLLVSPTNIPSVIF